MLLVSPEWPKGYPSIRQDPAFTWHRRNGNINLVASKRMSNEQAVVHIMPLHLQLGRYTDDLERAVWWLLSCMLRASTLHVLDLVNASYNANKLSNYPELLSLTTLLRAIIALILLLLQP